MHMTFTTSSKYCATLKRQTCGENLQILRRWPIKLLPRESTFMTNRPNTRARAFDEGVIFELLRAAEGGGIEMMNEKNGN